MTDNDENVSEIIGDGNRIENENENTCGIREEEWMLKPCETYLIEYKDCKALRSRFYQKFYTGKMLNCTQWKTDYENCLKWNKTNDDEAFNELLASEKKRRLERLKPHYLNDVWKRRNTPPSDWNDPLPQWMVEREKSTFLAMKQKEILETGSSPENGKSPSMCRIF